MTPVQLDKLLQLGELDQAAPVLPVQSPCPG